MAVTEPRLDEKIIAQLDRVLSSKAFRQADRLKRFLTFIVNETLAGRGEQLKEFVIGVEVFGKGSSFDPRNDPIVRVQARRLRSQLARYYQEEGDEDVTLIELPKGGYTPVFRAFRGMAPKRIEPSALVSRNTILLTPFADHSPAGSLKYICEGLAEELAHTLTALGTIGVVSAACDNPARMLTGRVRQSGGDVRIKVN